MSAAPLPFLGPAEIGAALDVAGAVEALERALRGGFDPASEDDRQIFEMPNGELFLMPSAANGGPFVKLLTIGGEPRIQGLCLAFDPETLAPAAILDAIALTSLRTAAVSALAVKHLAAPEARRLLVFGRGPQAHAHVEAIRTVRPIAEVEMIGREAGDVAELVGAADVICCCTTAREPLFDGTLVADGAVVVAIGSHEPGAREIDDALARRATIVVEAPAAALREAGDVIQAVVAGVLEEDTLIPLADLVRGQVDLPESTPRLFKSIGMGWEDALVGAEVLAATRAAGR